MAKKTNNESSGKRAKNGQFLPGVMPPVGKQFPEQDPTNGGRDKNFGTQLYKATGKTAKWYLKKAHEHAENNEWKAVQYILDRIFGKEPDQIEVFQSIQVEVIQHITSVIYQAHKQAGLSKEKIAEVTDNMLRLLAVEKE